MLQLKPWLLKFLQRRIGDGTRASFQYDLWTDLGPVYAMFGPYGPCQLQVQLHANVSDAVRDGSWNFLAAQSDDMETLQIVLSTMEVPLPYRGQDQYLWLAPNGTYLPKFSSKATWERIRNRSALVSWSKVIWFKQKIPRWSFAAWMAILGCIPTRDRFLVWGLNVPNSCVLCASGIETHQHLFFQCNFTVNIWTRFCGRMIASPPANFMASVPLSQLLMDSDLSDTAVVFNSFSGDCVHLLERRKLTYLQGASINQ